jgi:hypothetical protein
MRCMRCVCVVQRFGIFSQAVIFPPFPVQNGIHASLFPLQNGIQGLSENCDTDSAEEFSEVVVELYSPSISCIPNLIVYSALK